MDRDLYAGWNPDGLGVTAVHWRPDTTDHFFRKEAFTNAYLIVIHIVAGKFR